MRSVLKAVGAALGLGAVLTAGSPPGQEDPEEVALGLTRQRFEALSRLDVETLGELLADDYRYVGWRGGLITREERLRLIRSLIGTQDSEAFELSDLEARREGDGAVVVTGRAHQTGRFDGQAFDNTYSFTTVYGRRDGAWKVVAHQTTRIADDG